MVFSDRNLNSFGSVAGRSGMTYVAWIVAVGCETWDRCREGSLCLRQVSTLKLLSD